MSCQLSAQCFASVSAVLPAVIAYSENAVCWRHWGVNRGRLSADRYYCHLWLKSLFSKEWAAWDRAGFEQRLRVLPAVDAVTTENTNYLPKQSSSVAAIAQRGTLPQHPRGQPAIFHPFLFACFKCWGKIKGWNDEIKIGFYCLSFPQKWR